MLVVFCNKIKNSYKIKMNGFLAFFLIVSIFAFDTFCMNSLNFGPPAPGNVKFDECLLVPKITGEALSTLYYRYRHICREKFPDNGPRHPEHEKHWFLVGKLRDFDTQSPDKLQYDYVPIKQSLMKFIYMKDTTIEFISSSTKARFEIEFQSVQQRNAFSAIIYNNVILSVAAPKKIGLLHEMIGKNIVYIDSNVGAVLEQINGIWHITFKNARGEPLLIFSHSQAGISRINYCSEDDKPQLLFRAHTMYYILTFPNCDEAIEFSDALLRYISVVQLSRVHAQVKARFEKNQIKMAPNPTDVNK